MEVYLDNSATTRAYECVRDIVGKVMCEDYGNPSSMHKKGNFFWLFYSNDVP